MTVLLLGKAMYTNRLEITGYTLKKTTLTSRNCHPLDYRPWQLPGRPDQKFVDQLSELVTKLQELVNEDKPEVQTDRRSKELEKDFVPKAGMKLRFKPSGTIYLLDSNGHFNSERVPLGIQWTNYPFISTHWEYV